MAELHRTQIARLTRRLHGDSRDGLGLTPVTVPVRLTGPPPRIAMENGEMSTNPNFYIASEGRTFEAASAMVTPDYAAGYPGDVDGKLMMLTGRGDALGPARIIACWPTPYSWRGSHMYQIEATINGIVYTGRGLGENMLWRGKPKRKQIR